MQPNHLILRREGAVGVVQLHRPDAMNALSLELMIELVDALEAYDRDGDIRCIVVTGGPKVFAAGADIRDMAEATVAEMVRRNQFARWERIRNISKPVVAAVCGYALGGGCELAMLADIIVASETAQFGQPEINIGVMPGAGGTQRLTRAVGKSLAMEMVLNGRFIGAREALSAGLVSRVVAAETCLTEAMRIAEEISRRAPVALRLAKQAVLAAYDTTLSAGLLHERALFYSLFATEDQKEGMAAFIGKRKAKYEGK
ncbi:MAG: enoyl-CoA hydratase-related protein [Phycisphaerae bacterium]|nr:enoyl-CoA hydratase-related protein [Phycisphaerae bacterium]